MCIADVNSYWKASALVRTHVIYIKNILVRYDTYIYIYIYIHIVVIKGIPVPEMIQMHTDTHENIVI
jgi:hypothetical protein